LAVRASEHRVRVFRAKNWPYAIRSRLKRMRFTYADWYWNFEEREDEIEEETIREVETAFTGLIIQVTPEKSFFIRSSPTGEVFIMDVGRLWMLQRGMILARRLAETVRRGFDHTEVEADGIFMWRRDIENVAECLFDAARWGRAQDLGRLREFTLPQLAKMTIPELRDLLEEAGVIVTTVAEFTAEEGRIAQKAKKYILCFTVIKVWE